MPVLSLSFFEPPHLKKIEHLLAHDVAQFRCRSSKATRTSSCPSTRSATRAEIHIGQAALLFFPPSDAKFRPASAHALTQPRRSVGGARSVLPMRWGRSDSCPASPTTRRHPGKPTRNSTGEGACHQMPGASRCPVPLVPLLSSTLLYAPVYPRFRF
jgi:hypothetical protein